jgi:hypothetical protein
MSFEQILWKRPFTAQAIASEEALRWEWKRPVGAFQAGGE